MCNVYEFCPLGIILLSNPFDKVVLSKSILQLGKRKVGHLHFHQQTKNKYYKPFLFNKKIQTLLHPYVFQFLCRNMATPISEECYSDEEDDFVTSNSYEDGEDLDDYNHGGGEEGDMSGWQLAARGIKLALNNRIEDAQNLLRVDSSCIHRQAGFCYLTFIVSY